MKEYLIKVYCLSKMSVFIVTCHHINIFKYFTLKNKLIFILTVFWIDTFESDFIKDHMFRAVGQASFNPSHEKN